jgi:hypothetical protein
MHQRSKSRFSMSKCQCHHPYVDRKHRSQSDNLAKSYGIPSNLQVHRVASIFNRTFTSARRDKSSFQELPCRPGTSRGILPIRHLTNQRQTFSQIIGGRSSGFPVLLRQSFQMDTTLPTRWLTLGSAAEGKFRFLLPLAGHAEAISSFYFQKIRMSLSKYSGTCYA